MFLFLTSILVFASITLAQIFVPGPTPTCAPEDVDAAILFLPHERYCSLYYPCAPQLTTPYPAMACPRGTLWDAKLNICNWPDTGSQGLCPQWECNLNTKYPDVCCSTYWTCSDHTWTAHACPPGTVFDQTQGECASTLTAQCQSDLNCLEQRRPDFGVCTLTATSDVCVFYGQDNVERRCAEGTQFNQAACGCTTLSNACYRDSLLLNKANDGSCPASFAVQFNVDGSVTARSDKLGRTFQSNSFMSNGLSVSAGEAVFTQTSTGPAYLYAFYFTNLQFMPPTAFSLEVLPDSLVTNRRVSLLTNAFDVSANNQMDCVATVSVNVTSNGPGTDRFGQTSLNTVVLVFDAAVTGSRGERAVTSLVLTVQTRGTGLGINSLSPLSYIRVSVGVSAGEVTLQAEEMNTSLLSTNTVTSTSSFTDPFNGADTEIEAVGLSKCGLTVGRSFAGRMRKVSVYEGCSNGFAGVIAG